MAGKEHIDIKLPRFFMWLLRDLPDMETGEKIKRLFFVYLAIFMAFGAFVWGVICLSFSMVNASFIPFGFIAFTGFNLFFCRRSKTHRIHCHAQVFLSILLPFIFQFMLGGIAASGAVMLWSVVALLGAMTFQEKKMITLWFALLVVSIAGACWMEKAYFGEVGTGFSPLMLALNAICVCTILVFISRHFIDKQIDLRKKVISRTDLIKTKNKQINNSLESAKNIQQNILPSAEELGYSLADHFVFDLPRDVVSGDFYWSAHFEGRVFIACADCTGHGVPGAFMSMMGYNFLNQIFYKEQIHDPAQMLALLNTSIIEALKQETSGNNDGMDISIISYEPASGTLEFAGAKTRMVLMDETGKMTVIRGSKSSVGGMQVDIENRFENQRFKIDRGAKLFMMTDGIVDQFGGPKGKRVMTKRFYNWLDSKRNLSMSRTLRALELFYADWAGDCEQTDDILVVGLEF